MKKFTIKILLPAVCLVLLISVSALKAQQADTKIPVIKEKFETQRDQGDNVDSPAVWHGPDGQHWLLATAKEGDVIAVFDARDGSIIKRVGEAGEEMGKFERPNGIAVIDNLMLVVERDNKRIQVFSLPGFKSLGTMTHEDLRKPYGLTIDKADSETYSLFVTDNYNPSLEGYPPQGELDERIHHFRFTASQDTINSEHVRVFGDIRGEGVLHTVESLFIDRTYNRLLIADEAFNQRNIKVYDLEGHFSGEVIPAKYFESEPEGIALYQCSDGSGYWITTDQHESENNKFEVFDRESLDHIGTFKGEETRNTDGIWLTQQSFGPFENGAFYPVHDDGSVTAIAWADIAKALNLKMDCK